MKLRIKYIFLYFLVETTIFWKIQQLEKSIRKVNKKIGLKNGSKKAKNNV